MNIEGALQTIIERRDRLRVTIEALRNQIAGLEIAIGLLSNDATVASRSGPADRKPRVSDILIDLLEEAGDAGLTPKAVLERATDRGISLKRGSVYVLLNRMQRAGTLLQENSHYKVRRLPYRGHSDSPSNEEALQPLNRH